MVLRFQSNFCKACSKTELVFLKCVPIRGDVLFTEKMAGTQVYLIKEGQVDLFLMREERRVVVESLGKGAVLWHECKLAQQAPGG
jgi:hypothetical protein